jgi:hypothetical protein
LGFNHAVLFAIPLIRRVYSEFRRFLIRVAASVKRAVAVVHRTAAIEKRFNGLSGPSQTVSP